MDRRIIAVALLILLCASVAWGRMGIIAVSGQSGPIQSVYYSDDFNRSNGNLTTPWVSNTVRPIPQIASNQLYSSNNTLVGIYGAMPSDDYTACATVVTASNTQGGPVVRASTTEYTQYDFYPSSSSNLRLRRNVAASPTTLQDTAITVSDGDVVCLKVSGSSPVVLTGYLNGSQVVSYSDTSGSKISSGLNVGVMIYSGGIDNWYATQN